MPHLFEPFTIRAITLRNRIGVSPMCQYCYTDGMATDWHLVHLGSRAVGGAGLVICEATAVEPRGRITPHDLGIWSEAHSERLARTTQFIHLNGAIPGIQLAHAGRKAAVARPWDGGKPISDDEGGWDVIAPSALPFAEGFRTPAAMTLEDIQTVQEAFRQGALNAVAAGFQWFEIHAAHGYLLHSFYSPLSNQRTDHYGGVFGNRCRMVIEVAEKIREVVPENLPLGVRLSCTDWVENGWTIEDSIDLSKRLKAVGVDIIDCSSGSNTPNAPIPRGAGYQVPLSEAIRRGASIPTMAVGLITEPMQADEVIRNQRADVVLIGRAALRDPYWAINAAQKLKQEVKIPSQYLRAY